MSGDRGLASDRRPRWALALPALALLAGVLTALMAFRDEPTAESASRPVARAERPDAVRVSSDAPRLGSLAELVSKSDVVVRASVAATERGRWFGDGDGGTRIQSRLVTLEVAEVLSGDVPSADSILVEEEGWLEDGAPLVVDGAWPSQVGDDGVWFLRDSGDPDVGSYVIVNAQGRYLVAADGRSISGATGKDPLEVRIAHLTLDELTTRLRRG